MQCKILFEAKPIEGLQRSGSDLVRFDVWLNKPAMPTRVQPLDCLMGILPGTVGSDKGQIVDEQAPSAQAGGCSWPGAGAINGCQAVLSGWHPLCGNGRVRQGKCFIKISLPATQSRLGKPY
jgi:hypothetical protein